MTRTDTRLTFALLASTALAGAGPALSQTLPTGPSVAHGGIAISTPTPGAMTIQQSTGTAIVNWQGFSIGQGAQVNIAQPSAQSSLLNRVTGSTPSTIAGQLNANGRVYLVNPNGIVITKSGTVNTGAFVASTLDIGDEDFKAGRNIFTGRGASAAVVNEGAITVGAGGYAALLGGRVENSGTITVPMGQVGLGSGEQIRLDLSGDGFLQVAVPTAADPGTKALIENSGRIRANGGRVEMKAASAREAARNVINTSGIIEARTVSGRNGAIVLGGGEGGRVTVSGRLDTSGGRRQARRATVPARGYAKGGDITVTGNDIRLVGATLDASGAGGGGSIRIGGEYQGGGTLQRATTTSVDAASTIRADALVSGNGGRVIVWSDQLTTFDGLISAKGGPISGDGGFAEVSGKAVLAYSGLTDLSAANGTFGTLLLDPYNITITEPGDPLSYSQGTGSLNLGLIPPIAGIQFTPTANDSVISRTVIQSQLATSNVIINTGGVGSPGAQAGNITVAAPITWTAPTSLGLDAAGAIFVNAPITAAAGNLGMRSVLGVAVNAPLTFGAGGVAIVTGGNVALNANVTAGLGLFISAGNATGLPGLPAIGNVTSTGAVNVGAFLLARGNWTQVAPALPAFSAVSFTVAPGTASFLRAQGGAGSVANPYIIVDAYGLQGIGSSAALLTSNYAQGGPINAAGTEQWNLNTSQVPTGWLPIGTAPGVFAGSYDGRGQTISNLVVNRPGGTSVGLFGNVAGVISNVQLVNATVNGGSAVGTLVGNLLASGTVAGSSSSGSAAGTSNAGGLVGANAGTVTRSFSSATASAGTGNAGGLVGFNTGAITVSYATGAVSGGSGIGGLVGSNAGIIADTFATGATSGSSAVGGLVGALTAGSVATSYAAGPVSSTGAVGGLIGAASGGTVTNAYWDTQTTGQAASAGGTPQTTFQLESGLPVGFSPAVWAPGIAGVRYPTLIGLPIPDSVNVPSRPGNDQILDVAVTQPTFSRGISATPFPTTGNTTTIEVVGLGGGGGQTIGSGSSGGGGGGGGPTLGSSDGNSRAGATETLNFLQRSSEGLERQLAQCETQSERSRYTGCVGDALDQFANAIDTRSLTLPAPLRNVAAVIREAARGVRAAPTIAAARAVVRTAVAEVRKAIALIRADDPAVGRLQQRQGNVIASALRSVDSKLSRAVGL